MGKLKEIHGIRVSNNKDNSIAEVVVHDADVNAGQVLGLMLLEVKNAYSGARLTPDEAEHLAMLLWGAAKRARGDVVTGGPHFQSTTEPPLGLVEEPAGSDFVPWRPFEGASRPKTEPVPWNVGQFTGTEEIRTEGGPPSHREEHEASIPTVEPMPAPIVFPDPSAHGIRPNRTRASTPPDEPDIGDVPLHPLF